MRAMPKFLAIFLMIFSGAPALAQTVTAAHTLRSHARITAADLVLVPEKTPGSYSDPRRVVGREARTILYAGRPIFPKDIGPLSVVKRNQTVAMTYRHGALVIRTEGRALSGGGIGEKIRVMNSSSRATVLATVTAPGQVEVKK